MKSKSALRQATLLSMAAVAALVAPVGWMEFRVYHDQQAQAVRSEFVQADRQGALNLTTIDWQNADRDVQRILNGATGQFHDEFATRSQPFVDVIKQAKSTSVGTIAEAGLESEGSGRKSRRSTLRYSL
jgi:Mce-associated membrane protein